jgi:hypothetical protein
VSRNDITGDEIKTKAATTEYRANHEKVFGKTKIQRGRWIQDPETGKLVPASEYVSRGTNSGLMILVDNWDAYESPSTGNVISNRQQRDYDLKASGCRQYEGKQTEIQEASRYRSEQQQKLRSRMQDTFDRTYYEIEHGYRSVND